MPAIMLMISICAGPCMSHSARSRACMSLYGDNGVVVSPSVESAGGSAARAAGTVPAGEEMLPSLAVDSVRNELSAEAEDVVTLASAELSPTSERCTETPAALGAPTVPCRSCSSDQV